MANLTASQIASLAIVVSFVIAGIVAWIRMPRIGARRLVWGAPVTDTLMLTWAILFGAFLGQVAGGALLGWLPEAARKMDAVQVLVSRRGMALRRQVLPEPVCKFTLGRPDAQGPGKNHHRRRQGCP